MSLFLNLSRFHPIWQNLSDRSTELKQLPGGQMMSNLWNLFNSFFFIKSCSADRSWPIHLTHAALCVCVDLKANVLDMRRHMLPLLPEGSDAMGCPDPIWGVGSVWAAVTPHIRLLWPLMAWEACHVPVWYLPTPPIPAAPQPHHRRWGPDWISKVFYLSIYRRYRRTLEENTFSFKVFPFLPSKSIWNALGRWWWVLGSIPVVTGEKLECTLDISAHTQHSHTPSLVSPLNPVFKFLECWGKLECLGRFITLY